jgi:hypothetical protein
MYCYIGKCATKVSHRQYSLSGMLLIIIAERRYLVQDHMDELLDLDKKHVGLFSRIASKQS